MVEGGTAATFAKSDLIATCGMVSIAEVMCLTLDVSCTFMFRRKTSCIRAFGCTINVEVMGVVASDGPPLGE